MANLAIRGHEGRGKEVIEILEMLGGKSYTVYAYKGEDPDRFYCINKANNFIDSPLVLREVQIFSLEEFLEKFPYKIGDKVIAYAEGCLAQFTIQDIRWNDKLNKVEYKICSSWRDTSSIQQRAKEQETIDKANKAVFDANAQCCDIMNHLIKEETMEEPTIRLAPEQLGGEQVIVPIPKGYEFAGVDDDNQQVVFEKIKPKYPKTHEECCKVLDMQSDWHLNFELNTDADCDLCVNKEFEYVCKLEAFRKLLICRNAYWKLYGAWERGSIVYVIRNAGGKFIRTSITNPVYNHILAFPTAEMRNAFYENFKDLIKQCKELL